LPLGSLLCPGSGTGGEAGDALPAVQERFLALENGHEFVDLPSYNMVIFPATKW